MPASRPDHAGTAAQNHRLAYLDGWRGLCIITVLFGHFSPIHRIDFGAMGVEMFFVLSGRLMAEILFREKIKLLNFYVRRFSRVWPGLFVYVLICAVLFTHVQGFLHVSRVAILAALSFTSNYKNLFFGQTQLLDHTWSLSVEEHSYLALGLIAYICRNDTITKIKYIVLGCALAMAMNGVIQSDFFSNPNFDIYWRSDIRCGSVFCAAFLYLHITDGAVQTRCSAWLIFTALAASSLCFYVYFPEWVSFTLGTACLAFIVCSFEISAPAVRGFFSNKLLVLFGTYSYSIYLWQQFFYKLFQDLRATGALTKWEGALLRPAFVIGACAIGVLSYYVIERPARRYINAKWAALPAGLRRETTISDHQPVGGV